MTIALVFLRLGATALGGPAAHIALMESELVEHKQWLSHQEFVDLLGAASLIPGPNSTEMAIHIGYKKAGLSGLAVAGVCFILPAFLMVFVLSCLYVRYGKLPLTNSLLYGLKPVIIAVVLQTLWLLIKSSADTLGLKLVALLACICDLLGANELTLLFGSGFIAAVLYFVYSKPPRENKALTVLGSISALIICSTCLLASYGPKNIPYSLQVLFLYFLKLGSVLYGGGYVLLAFLRTDLVENYHWISSAQLLDAIAIGQITPGPLFTTATFVGYLLGGPLGAIVATVGIFLPAFILVSLTAPLIAQMRASAIASHFLNAVNAAAVGLMIGVSCQLAQSAFVDALTISIGCISILILLRFKTNSMWLMLGGGLSGLILHH